MNSTFHSINCHGTLLSLAQPKIMGILNITPDSFSDGGKFNDEKKALIQVEKMLSEGVDIIDIGAQSTRPNADFLSAKEEITRLGNLISTIKKTFPESLISLDSFWTETIIFGYNEGIDIINDISAGQFDAQLLPTVARMGLPYILMHINPSYHTMHEKIVYEDITTSVNYFLLKKAEELRNLGIIDIILDPGFGFGKTIEDQHKMIDEVSHIGMGKFPLLIGISRKSFIYKPLEKSPLEINEETQKLHLKVLKQGAKILRVHDVKEAKKTVNEFLNLP